MAKFTDGIRIICKVFSRFEKGVALLLGGRDIVGSVHIGSHGPMDGITFFSEENIIFPVGIVITYALPVNRKG